MRFPTGLAILLTALATPALSAAQGLGQKTVRVDCGKGHSIQKALEEKADDLVVEIRGICHEEVVIERNQVTLSGSDPDLDGIRGSGAGTTGADGVLEVRGAHEIEIENLQVSGGGRTGIALNQGFLVEITNCRSFDNEGHAIASHSTDFVTIRDSTLGPVGGRGLSVFSSDNVVCERCVIDAAVWGVLAAESATVDILDSTVSGGRIALVSAIGGSVLHTGGSTLTTGGPFGVVALDHATIRLVDNRFDGGIDAEAYGFVDLTDSTQTANPVNLNFVDAHSMIQTFGGSSTQGEIVISGFSSLVLQDSSTHAGGLECRRGGDASCDDPAAVSGAVTGCDHCNKP